MSDRPLHGQVAVVAGATRGAGRGIARMLGAAGATVYCTGRSVRGRPATAGRPETIEETAEMVTAEGGRGIAVRTDHTVESEVERLFDRVRADEDRLDVLVNDIWGGDALTEWGSPSDGPHLDPLHRPGGGTARAGRPQPHHHQPARDATDDRARRRTHRRGDRRRHVRVSRQSFLRPGQERRHPARLRDGGGSARPSRDRPRGHAGISAFRGRTRHLRRHRSELAGCDREGCVLRRVGDALLRRPSRGGAGRRPPCRAEERPAVLELGIGEGVRVSRTSTGAGRIGAASSCAGSGTSSNRRRRRTTWTVSWFAAGSTRPSSTRPPPRKPRACAPG